MRQYLRTLATTIPDFKSAAAQISSNEELAAIVHRFSPGVEYAFGYGSGVFHQHQPSSLSLENGGRINDDDNAPTASPGMIDIILAVQDPHSWHTRNMERHSDHYSALARCGGPRFVTQLQVNYGAKIYFHPFANMSINMSRKQSHSNLFQRQIKYGVVSTHDLIHDLVHWDYLYLAGRMHKPIVSIELTPADGPDRTKNVEQELDASATRGDNCIRHALEEAQRTNLLSAVSASLLLLQPSTSSTQLIHTSQLYNTIASLSYTGDFRMQTGAEDPNKIKKLVETPGMMERWDQVYSETLGNMQKLGLLGMVAIGNISRCLEISVRDRSIRKQLAKNLPRRLQRHLDLIVGADDSIDSIRKGGVVLRQELANIVSPAAKSQSIKGFLTAGVGKSWKYALAKFAKGRLRK